MVDNMHREHMMQLIMQLCFAVTDMSLYLDTHPYDKKALAYFNEMNQRLRSAEDEYAKAHGPLSLDDVQCSYDSWKWINEPWPWEACQRRCQ